MKLRKLNRSIHRDLGYIFFFLTVLYGLSGIALNHIDDWNPSYIIRTEQFKINSNYIKSEKLNRSEVLSILNEYTPDEKYKSHYYPSSDHLKIFIRNGSVVINTETYVAFLETTKRRPIFHQANFLHYNKIPTGWLKIQWWKVLSDIYAGALIILAFSGLFILKGKNGITRRGAWLTAIGVIIPILFLLKYYWKVF